MGFAPCMLSVMGSVTGWWPWVISQCLPHGACYSIVNNFISAVSASGEFSFLFNVESGVDSLPSHLLLFSAAGHCLPCPLQSRV